MYYVSKDYVSTDSVCGCPWQFFALVKLTLSCASPETASFQFIYIWVKVQLCFVRVR